MKQVQLFFRVVGSELAQKYSGEGPKLVRELFRLAQHVVFLLFLLMKLMQLAIKGLKPVLEVIEKFKEEC